MADVIERLDAALEERYRVHRQLGEGGMATVYLADDLRHERKVALKVLKPELAAVVGADRFLAEIKTTANLQHPNILPLFDSGEAGGFLFYAMPYVEGESLRQRLEREHQLPVDDAVRIAASVADALDYAHRHGVIHRDIKPANILLQDGKPVISDFGIALAVGAAGGGRLTETGLSLGTPHYMSPEQATGDLGVGPAADIYAVGCVLYEMLVGEPPYTGNTAQAILGKIIQAEPVSATASRRSVPVHVDAAIRRSLEKLAADRFATARDLGAALANPTFRHGEVERVGIAAAGRSAALPALGAALVASLVTGSVVWSVASDRVEPPATVTRFSLELPGEGLLRGSTVQPLELTRDGHALVVNVLTQGGSGSQLYLRRLESLETTPIRGTEGVGSFALSPDGEWIAFNAIDGTLKRVPLSGGQPTTIASGLPTGGGFRGSAWGEGGLIVFASSDYVGLMQAPESGGVAEPLTAPEEGSGELHSRPSFVSGGEHVLFEMVTADGPAQIALLSLATGEYGPLAAGNFPQYVEAGHVVFRRGNTLWAAELDVDGQRLVEDPVPVLEGVDPQFRRFSVSRNGTLVYAPETEEFGSARALAWIDRQGREDPLPVEPQPYVYPRLSPAGDRLAVAVAEDVLALGGEADLWIFDLDRFARSRITFGGNHRFYPIWTPDGERLTHADGSTATNNLLWSAADGVGGTDTLLLATGRRFPTSWSPDGRALAFYAGPQGTPTESRDLWMLHLRGDSVTPEPFLATPYQDRAPAFSPDGRWVTYVSNKSGRDEVYVVPYPGPGAEWTVSTAGGGEPVWSRDGTELFYRTDDQLMVVDVELGDAFRTSVPRPLFSDPSERDPAAGAGIPNYDVAPDGERFLMVRRNGIGSRATLVVVENWDQELRRLLSN